MSRWLLLSCLLVHAGVAAEPMSLSIRGHQVSQSIFSVFASPGERIPVGHGGDPVVLGGPDRSLVSMDRSGIVIAAPEAHGRYELKLQSAVDGKATTLNLWVGIPDTHLQGEYLNGYRIGQYPPARSKRPNYEAPRVFFEVTAENVDTRVSQNFTMRQFLCKQDSGFPKYVVLQESLLVTLEGLLADVQAAGYDIETFGVISGYRTPWYNRRIGNVPYSRHVYGDAMDIFIDVDGDGRMDDINNDGMHNPADILKFFGIVDRFMRRPENAGLLGGVGKYNKTGRHGGFVHVDTRGYQARW